MQKLKNLKLIVFLLLITISISLAYLFFTIESKEGIWFLVSVSELGIIGILAFIVFKLSDILEIKKMEKQDD